MRLFLSALVALTVFASLVYAVAFSAQPIIPQAFSEKTPLEFRNPFLPGVQPLNYVPKSPGHYSRQDWAAAIDATWGEGLPYEEKISLFTYFWEVIDSNFAAFQGLDADIWDSIWAIDSAQIWDTVSRGRLCGLMQHSCIALRESHTKVFDTVVTLANPLPGVPLMYIGGWGWTGHFGAGLTPLPDSSLLVYKAIESHPLGLVPGDLILGYDNIPWKDLYPELLAAQLPISTYGPYWWGSSESAFTHSCLMACGDNWHLFDIIDIVKYESGDTLHLSTSLLVDQNNTMYLNATEQMDIPGISMPLWYTGEYITWGVIEGTSIGYIYSIGWHGDSAQIITAWKNALDSLMDSTTGLIIDVRTNSGASYSFMEPLELLFDETVEVLRADIRCTGGGQTDMCLLPGGFMLNDFYTVSGEPSTFYDKPIAVLTGPGSLSGGDLFPVVMAQHPMTKLFGKPTTGARNGGWWRVLDGDWSDISFCFANTYLASNPGEYLTRKEFPNKTEFPWANYEEVWLTRDGVAQGRDEVVEAAIAWIGRISGDANGDETVNVGDAVYLIAYVFKGGPAPDPVCEGDANGDHDTNIGDAVYLISYIFKGGPAPVVPCCL